MYWWNSFYTWLTNVSTQPVFFSVLIFIVGVAVAGALSAFIARGAIKSLLTQRDREQRVAAIGALVDAATEASVWNSLTPQEQVLADRTVGQADIQVRLLPIKGSDIAANWAAHQLAELKRTSATFGYQLEPAVHEFRDRLIEWQNKPSRARKIFLADLNRWRTQVSATEETLVAEQDAWVAKNHHNQFADATSAPSTETQKLLDDVRALEVRPAETGETAVTPV
ncbi:hypothetical protein [Glaciibacter psychrotolerans]|uniref:Uncharacterized protein n=1 Tax=Glaciibacter psychrotolerans TaxID=670054 RepID=A0A7Z0EE31_9MICO|nr:hypothetical protein [Leifsonia psychrotolerans]NYJ19217.1 hypothetical protein [Leifsonia psychrotolerans]